MNAPSSDQVNGITIIEMPTKDGSLFGTTILIDNGFTGYAIMSHDTAETLGLEFEPISSQSYVTATGNMDTKFQATVHGIRLPHLSRHRTFSATFKIAPKESGDFGFGVIMGIDMMDDLGIDTSRTTKSIIWGNDIEVPMVSKNHRTEARIQALCGVHRRSSQNSSTPSENTTTKTDIYVDDSITSITMQPSTLPSESSLFLAANQSAPSFTKAVYVKPDLLEVVKRDGVNLTTDQQALLFRMLSNHNAVFKAVKGIIPASQSSYACDPTQFHDEPNHMRFQSKIAKSWKMNLPDNVKLEPLSSQSIGVQRS